MSAKSLSDKGKSGGRARHKIRAVRLRTGLDCQRALAQVFNGLRRGELKETRARTLTYILSVAIRGVELGNLDERLRVLEAKSQEHGSLI